ncbi:MAG: toprim domain-containing protein [Pseudomonadota bacterium]
MLLAQLDQVVYHYAPAVAQSHETHGKYFTLNPGRADRSVGSFYVHMGGPKAGNWTDHATGEFGDVLDLIALSLNCDLKAALREARAFLGLETASPELIRQRRQAADQAKRRRKEQEQSEKDKQWKRARLAHRIWLSGQASIKGTPIEYYLRDTRGIDLSRLGRQPGALRYVPDCFYKHVDDETGEVTEGRYPAMVAIVVNHRGMIVACHRTYLALNAQGLWDKAPVPKAKKVLGTYGGSAINLWKGVGPQGGKPSSLPKCPPGTRVLVAEGIEDALSAVLLLPHERVLSAISLSNMQSLILPDNVAEVTFLADRDEKPEQREALDRAVQAHQKAGRKVRVFLNKWGGKDLNDALRQSSQQPTEGAA